MARLSSLSAWQGMRAAEQHQAPMHLCASQPRAPPTGEQCLLKQHACGVYVGECHSGAQQQAGAEAGAGKHGGQGQEGSACMPPGAGSHQCVSAKSVEVRAWEWNPWQRLCVPHSSHACIWPASMGGGGRIGAHPPMVPKVSVPVAPKTSRLNQPCFHRSALLARCQRQ